MATYCVKNCAEHVGKWQMVEKRSGVGRAGRVGWSLGAYYVTKTSSRHEISIMKWFCKSINVTNKSSILITFSTLAVTFGIWLGLFYITCLMVPCFSVCCIRHLCFILTSFVQYILEKELDDSSLNFLLSDLNLCYMWNIVRDAHAKLKIMFPGMLTCTPTAACTLILWCWLWSTGVTTHSSPTFSCSQHQLHFQKCQTTFRWCQTLIL